MHKNILSYSCMLMIAFAMLPMAKAQDKPATTPAAPTQKNPVDAYHLDFSLDELQNGKKINSRQYSMNVSNDSSPKTLKIGTRVPVESENGKFDYMDVGTSITAQMVSWQTPLGIDIYVDISNFANPDEVLHGNGRPILRQMRISGRMPVVLGKPMVVGSVEDPNSDHQFQLEVTIAKL